MHSLDIYPSLVDYIYEESVDEIMGMPALSDYFMEEGDKQNPLAKLVESVQKFFKRIIDTIVAFFGKIKTRLSAIKLPASVRSKKIQIPQKYQKLIDQGKISSKKLNSCKTQAQVDAAISEYRKKKIAIMAGTATLTLTVAAAIALIAKRSGSSKKEAEEARDSVVKDLNVVASEVKATQKAEIGRGKNLTPKKPAVMEEEQTAQAKAKTAMEIQKDVAKSEQDFVSALLKAAENIMNGGYKPTPTQDQIDKATEKFNNEVNELKRWRSDDEARNTAVSIINRVFTGMRTDSNNELKAAVDAAKKNPTDKKVIHDLQLAINGAGYVQQLREADIAALKQLGINL